MKAPVLISCFRESLVPEYIRKRSLTERTMIINLGTNHFEEYCHWRLTVKTFFLPKLIVLFFSRYKYEFYRADETGLPVCKFGDAALAIWRKLALKTLRNPHDESPSKIVVGSKIATHTPWKKEESLVFKCWLFFVVPS